jgi:3-methyladenine DNA glycosylase AlkD
LKNQFEFYGISSPERRIITKQFFSEHGLPDSVQMEEIVRILWEKKQRELQYFAMELIDICKNKGRSYSISLVEFTILNKSWWDTVDFIATKLAGDFFIDDRRALKRKSKEWISSGNLWLMRSAIICQLKFKKETDFELLSHLILRTNREENFFIRKAIGWALREYSKSQPDAIVFFVRNNYLSGLSKKEATKRISGLAVVKKSTRKI